MSSIATAFVELCKGLENSHGVRFVPSKLLIDMAEKGDASAALQVSARQPEACKLDEFLHGRDPLPVLIFGATTRVL